MIPQDALRALEPEVDAYVDALLATADAQTGHPPVSAASSAMASATDQIASPARIDSVPAFLPPAQLMPAAIREIARPAAAVQDAVTGDTPAPAPPPSGQRWLRVAVRDDRYAVELLRVQEVVRVVPVIAVRGAVPSLLGVMNLRGRIVPVHDLGRWLHGGAITPDERARIVVLEHQDELVGLLVTAVTDVVTLDAGQIEPPTRGTRDRTGLGIARTPGAPPTVLLDARVAFD